MTDSEYTWVVKYRRFKYCFQDLYKLDCIYCIKILILDKLSVTCRNIRILHIDYYIINHDVDHSLFKLIEEQNQIKGLHIIANRANLDYQKILRNGEHNLDSLISKFKTIGIILLC